MLSGFELVTISLLAMGMKSVSWLTVDISAGLRIPRERSKEIRKQAAKRQASNKTKTQGNRGGNKAHTSRSVVFTDLWPCAALSRVRA